MVHLALIGQVWASEDMEEIDADVEETIADSTAANEEAKATRERAIKEKEETRILKRQAEKARDSAAAKRAEAQVELERADKVIQTEKAEQAVLHSEVKKHEQNIAENIKKIEVSQAKVEKVKGETETLKTLRSEQDLKIAEQVKLLKELKVESRALDQKLTEAKAEFEKSRATSKDKGNQLSLAQAALGQKQSNIDAKIAELKTRQPNQAGGTAGGQRVTVIKDCKVYAQPDSKSKVLGIKKAGTSLRPGPTMKHWVSFPIPNGRTGYLVKTCL